MRTNGSTADRVSSGETLMETRGRKKSPKKVAIPEVQPIWVKVYVETEIDDEEHSSCTKKHGHIYDCLIRTNHEQSLAKNTRENG
jgi:hypothetical protein